MIKNIDNAAFRRAGASSINPDLLQQTFKSIASVLCELMLPELTTALSGIVQEKQNDAINVQLLSPEKACALFDPKISKPTLLRWEKEGHFNRYQIGSRVFYKVGEIVDAAKHLKRYKKEVSHG